MERIILVFGLLFLISGCDMNIESENTKQQTIKSEGFAIYLKDNNTIFIVDARHDGVEGHPINITVMEVNFTYEIFYVSSVMRKLEPITTRRTEEVKYDTMLFETEGISTKYPHEICLGRCAFNCYVTYGAYVSDYSVCSMVHDCCECDTEEQPYPPDMQCRNFYTYNSS